MAVTSRPIDYRPGGALAQRLGKLAPLITAAVYGLLILALVLLMQRGLVWGQRRWDDLRYGYPRTVQLSAALGGGAPTQIVAVNLEGQVAIMIFPGGDVSRLSTLPGPYVVGEDGRYAAPELTLSDLSGDGADDLLVTVRGETIVYLNRGESFSLITAEERAMLAGQGDGQ